MLGDELVLVKGEKPLDVQIGRYTETEHRQSLDRLRADLGLVNKKELGRDAGH